MNVALTILDILTRLGHLVAELIKTDPDGDKIKAETVARLSALQALLTDDPVAKSLQAQLDAAVPRG
jgi:hypothetical protein